MAKGSRGGSRGGGGGYGGFGSLQGLIQAGQQNAAQMNGVNTDPNKRGTWDDNGNPQVVKYQGQDEDKLARYLAKVYNEVNLNDPQYNDGYNYYDNSLQKLVLGMGVNKGPTVVSESEFNQYVQATGAEVKYRGMSGKDAADRFMYAANNHVGNGVYGDGHYFTNNFQTAERYGEHSALMKGGSASDRVVLKMALSPTASVIDHSTLQKAMSYAGVKLRNGLSKAGSVGSRSYGVNDGEAQFAMRLGYNAVRVSSGYASYEYAIDRSALIVSKKRK